MTTAERISLRLPLAPRSGALRLATACVPTAVVLGLTELSHQGFDVIPVPWLLLLTAVGFGGYFAGRLPGTACGLAAAGLVFHGYLDEFGPESLTGRFGNAAAGMVLFVVVGFALGRLRDQRDSHYEALLETQRREQEEPLLLASRLAKLGYYIWDAVIDEPIVVSDQHIENYGTTRENFLAKVSSSGGEFLLVHPDDRKRVDAWCRKVEDGELVDMEYRIQAGGDERWMRAIVRPICDDAGRVVREIGASLDITAQKSIEAHLAEAQRLESIGRLSAGVAHDFNNLLAVILGNLELMARLGLDEQQQELVDAASHATLRGSELTKQLLTVGRRAPLQSEIIDANAVVRDMGELFRRTLPADIELECVLGGGLWMVDVDRPQFENALLNLVINARDAMPDGGALTIESANVRLDEAYCDGRGADLEPGRHVMIAVSDNGTGITPENLSLAFEPFFSTKEVGKGSGLGLALVHGFVKQSGGSVQVYSEIGEGTTVKLYFPAKGKSVVREAERSTDEPLSEVHEGGRMLIVDDDPDVRQVVGRQMKSVGFEVVEALDGPTALEILRADPTIRLLITDLVMPGTMKGTDLADIATAEKPDLQVILMTGYAKSAAENGERAANGYPKLTKPVQLDELTRVVRRALTEN